MLGIRDMTKLDWFLSFQSKKMWGGSLSHKGLHSTTYPVMSDDNETVAHSTIRDESPWETTRTSDTAGRAEDKNDKVLVHVTDAK